jgi:hypothetical protein
MASGKMVKSKLVAAIMAWALMVAMPLSVLACAPEFPVAILVNRSHPDIPLSLFAAGKLGVIQPTWAKSYLCVAYRYLTSKPLNKVEQAGIVHLWHKRLLNAQAFANDSDAGQNATEQYLKLRAQVVNTKSKDLPNLYYAVDSYSYAQSIKNDAFVVALKTLRDRIKQFGLHSKEVLEWLNGQDIVFGIKSKDAKAPAIPRPVKGTVNLLISADRDYQIAAANLYARHYKEAAALFEQISRDSGSPWKSAAPYLVARAKFNLARCSETSAGSEHSNDNNNSYANKNNAGTGPSANPKSATAVKANADPYQDAVDFIQAQLRIEKNSVVRGNLMDLLMPLQYCLQTRAELLAGLVKSVLGPNSPRFGGDVGDLTFTMDDSSGEPAKDEATAQAKADPDKELFEKYDLTDWLSTIQQREDLWFYGGEDDQKRQQALWKENAAHAISKWRKTGSLHWLVAVMCTNGLRSAQLNNALEAAQKIGKDSPAYLTATFFVNDALIQKNLFAEVRRRLKVVLSRKDLPPSDRNLFQAQELAVSNSIEDYLKNAFMAPPAVDSGWFQLPKNWLQKEANSAYYSETPVMDDAVAEDLNRNLPLSIWLQLAHNEKLNAVVRGRVIRATWLRAQLLHQQRVADELSRAFAEAYPQVAPLIHSYEQAESGPAKQYALARLVLKTYGISPYVQSGIERHGETLDQFDYYNANYWRALQPVVPIKKVDAELQDYYPSVQQPGTSLIAQFMQSYYRSGLSRLLSSAQRAAAKEDARTIYKQRLSAFLGEPVFAWIRAHPSQPDAPELLYKIVRLPKWTFLDETGSKYSHRAYNILHNQYPRSPWTQKAVCWY